MSAWPRNEGHVRNAEFVNELMEFGFQGKGFRQPLDRNVPQRRDCCGRMDARGNGQSEANPNSNVQPPKVFPDER
jgi:hypothetical protein